MEPWMYGLIVAGVALLVIAGIVAFVLSKKYSDEIFRYRVWKKIYHIAQDQDFFLLNDVNVKTEETSLHISHLLLGEKFVYVFASRPYEGNICGASYTSKTWQIKDDDGEVLRDVTNPVLFNEQRTMMLAKYLGWDESKTPMFISLVVVPDKVNIDIANPALSKYSYLIHRKEINKVIKKIEKESQYTCFDAENLQLIVERIHRFSLENNQEEKREKGRN